MLTTNELTKLKQELISREATLRTKIEQDKMRASEEEYSTELSDYDNHPGDQGTELYERQKDLAITAHEKAELEMIKNAINRIENNQYGICETCGKAIDLERLSVRPETSYCYEHAEKQPSFTADNDISMSALEIDDTDSWNALENYGTSESPSDKTTDQENSEEIDR